MREDRQSRSVWYGRECRQSQLGENGTCPSRDSDGHGTHVAGIAVGDGSGAGDVVPLGGAEVTWTSVNDLALSARLGALGQTTGAATSPLSFGAGVRARQVAIDYAYQSFDALALTTHRFGLRWWR